MTTPQGSILITGANGGLGTAFVANLLKSSQGSQYQGVYTVRNPATALELKSALAKGPQTHKYEILALDLSSLESIRGFAEDINTKVANGALKPIRALILNAAWQQANEETLKPQTFTKDGFETTFGVNYLANFLLVLLLLRSMDKEHGRIIPISSYTHDPYDPSNSLIGIYGEGYKENYKGDTESLAKGIEYTDDGYKAGMRRYGASKTLMVLFMYELQKHLNADPALQNISVLSLDPGGMGGSLTKNSNPPFFVHFLSTYIIPYLVNIITWLQPNGPVRSPMKSGADVLRAAFDVKSLGEFPKTVFLDGTAFKETAMETRDEEKQKKLWNDSVKLVRLREGETVLKL